MKSKRSLFVLTLFSAFTASSLGISNSTDTHTPYCRDVEKGVLRIVNKTEDYAFKPTVSAYSDQSSSSSVQPLEVKLDQVNPGSFVEKELLMDLGQGVAIFEVLSCTNNNHSAPPNCKDIFGSKRLPLVENGNFTLVWSKTRSCVKSKVYIPLTSKRYGVLDFYEKLTFGVTKEGRPLVTVEIYDRDICSGGVSAGSQLTGPFWMFWK